MTIGVVPRTYVTERVIWVDFHCPNARCRRYLFTVENGTAIQRGYCRACGLKYENQVAR